VCVFDVVLTHADLSALKQIIRATRDAHKLYHRYVGFVSSPAPEKWMIRRQMQVIGPATPGGSDATRENDSGR